MDKKLIVINDICTKMNPGKKQLQKLLYLMERHGLDLNLNYSIHFFGPYSAKLDYCLHEYESNGAIMIDTSKMTHEISVVNKQENGLDSNDDKIEKFVLTEYISYSALELEAITTIDYVAHTMFKNQKNKEEIIAQVKLIKGEKFSDTDLNIKYNILVKNKLLT